MVIATLNFYSRTGYTDSQDPDYIDHIRNDVGYDMDVVQNVRDIKEPFIKIAVCDFDGTEKRLRAYFQERFGDRIKIVTSGNIWIDFIAPNANKGSALSNIVSSLGMDPKNGITFGDQYNDLEMLQLSNIKLCHDDCCHRSSGLRHTYDRFRGKNVAEISSNTINNEFI